MNGGSYSGYPEMIMDADSVVLMDYSEYAEIIWPRHESGTFDVYLYCYGGDSGGNQVHLIYYIDGWLYSGSIEDCTYEDYDVLHWEIDMGYGFHEAEFRFYRYDGYVKYAPNPSWSDAIIKIDVTSQMNPTYFFVEDLDFIWMSESYYEDHPTHDDLHSEVYNYVVFYDNDANLQTITFYVGGGDREAEIGIHSKCLQYTTSVCQMHLKIDTTFVEASHGWSDNLWKIEWFGDAVDPTFTLTEGYHTITIYHAIGEVGWDYVAVDLVT
jgi:hypothetical protein